MYNLTTQAASHTHPRSSSLPEHRLVNQQQHEQIQTALAQIGHALTVFSSAADKVSGAGAQLWLQPHARTAESAMHQLRDLGATVGQAAGELSQTLTVLVLVADLIANGQISNAAEGRDLLRRNAYRAAGCLHVLQAQLR